jgi:hypothetical protein
MYVFIGEERSIAEERSLENEDYLGIYTISGKKIMNTYRERDDTVAVCYCIFGIHIHINICIYTYICVCMHIYMYIYMYEQL